MAGTATFIGLDTTTLGAWVGVYGADGYKIIEDTTSNPAYCTPTISGGASFDYGAASAPNNLQKASNPSLRIRAVQYNGATNTITVAITDGNPHRFTLHVADWDAIGRVETLTVKDGGTTLDVQTATGFATGQYFTWELTGTVTIELAHTAGANNVFSAWFFDPVPTVTTTETIDGVSRIQTTVDATQPGLAKIQATTDRTIAGVGNIQATTDRTIDGVARIQLSTEQTVDGVSRIQTTVDATQPGLAAIQDTTTRTQTGVARLQLDAVLQTVDGVANIQATTARTIDGVAAIQDTTTRTQTGVATIEIVSVQGITGQSRIQATTDRTVVGVGNVRATLAQTVDGVASIAITTTNTQPGVARIEATATRTITGTAKIQGASTQTVDGKANIRVTTTATQPGVAKIQQRSTPTITGKSRITASALRTVGGKAAIQDTISRTQDGGAYIVYRYEQPQTGVANIYGTTNKTITGVATIYDSSLFTAEGMVLLRGNEQVINASAVPLSLKACTVVVVAKTNDISVAQTLVGNIPRTTDNGFSIDVLADGAVAFRAQYDGAHASVLFPTGTVVESEPFMAILTFNDGRLTGQINLLSPQARMLTFPNAPVTDSDGWFFGRPSTDYAVSANDNAVYARRLFGTFQYREAATVASTVAMEYFSGVLSWAMFYDRPLYDFEIRALYLALKARLSSERGVSLP